MRTRTLLRRGYIRPFLYAGILLASLYVAHFATDLFFPFVTTHAHQAAAAEYLAAHNLPTPPEPFRTDGCTLFPDRLPWHDFRDVCVAHDIAYWAGGSRERQQATNHDLRSAVADVGPLGPAFGVLMYVAVVYFGDNGISRTLDSHWGYGWS